MTEAEEMVIEYSPHCTHEDLSVHPKPPHRKASRSSGVCNPSCCGLETGRFSET